MVDIFIYVSKWKTAHSSTYSWLNKIKSKTTHNKITLEFICKIERERERERERDVQSKNASTKYI